MNNRAVGRKAWSDLSEQEKAEIIAKRDTNRAKANDLSAKFRKQHAKLIGQIVTASDKLGSRGGRNGEIAGQVCLVSDVVCGMGWQPSVILSHGGKRYTVSMTQFAPSKAKLSKAQIELLKAESETPANDDATILIAGIDMGKSQSGKSQQIAEMSGSHARTVYVSAHKKVKTVKMAGKTLDVFEVPLASVQWSFKRFKNAADIIAELQATSEKLAK